MKTSDREEKPLDLYAGARIEDAKAVLILLHGRGATADSILSLHEELHRDGLAAVAPQAAGNSWYPQSFLAPLANNQPWLDASLNQVESLVAKLLSGGIRSERVAILGFSQGACLTCEFIARNPRRYGAVMALAGGLIGPLGTPREYPGSLDGTPVFLGAGDPDPHVPFERVRETETVLMKMKANVEVRRYPGMPHSINADALEVCRELLQQLD